MRLPTFQYVGAQDLAQASRLLRDDPEGTRLVAGGTDLWPNMKRRHQNARTVVSLRRIPELRGVCQDMGGGLVVGGMTTLTDILRSKLCRASAPGLVRAVASISSPPLRNMGTIGGNLCLDTRCTYYNQNEEWRQAIGYCMKEVGETCWVAPGSPRCWAVQASDSAPALCAMDASVTLVSTDGERTIPLRDLYNDDGIVYLTKGREEILTAVHVPVAESRRSTYWKLRRRGSIDFPVLGVGASVDVEGDVITDARIFLGAVHSFPIAAASAADHLKGRSVADQAAAEDLVEEAAALARDPATPMDNTDFTLQWRRRMVSVYVSGALRELLGLPATVRPSDHGLAAMQLEV